MVGDGAGRVDNVGAAAGVVPHPAKTERERQTVTAPRQRIVIRSRRKPWCTFIPQRVLADPDS